MKKILILASILSIFMLSCQSDWEYDDSFQWGEAGAKIVPDPAPILNSLSPDNGPSSGGTTITLYGSNFQSGATVLIGGSSCSDYNYSGIPSQIICITPPGSFGQTDVTVVNPDTQYSILTGSFWYDADPVLNTVSPDHGLPAGGTTITLTGLNFQSGATVTIGSSSCSDYNYSGVPGQIVCDSPSGTLGQADVTLTNPDTKYSTLVNGFTYSIPGILDPGFGTSGILTTNPSTGYDSICAVCVDSNYIYIAGHDSAPGDYEWRIEKRSKIDGSIVTSFGTSGVVSVNPSSVDDCPLDMVIDSTYLYVAGYDKGPGTAQWRIEKRFLSDGSLEATFGPGGVVTSSLSSCDYAYCLALDSSYLYLAGFDAIPGDQEWRIEKRNLADGSLVSSFGTNGVVTSNPSSSGENPYDIAIDSSYMYVVGYDSSGGGGQWRVEKRSLSDGTFDPSFGNSGVIISNPSSGWEPAEAVAIDSTSIYVFGRDRTTGDFRWRLEKRSLSDGSLDYSFGALGVITSNPSVTDDSCSALIIDASYLYLVGSENYLSSMWRVERRCTSDGALDGAFGATGYITTDHGSGPDSALAAAKDSSHIFVAGIGSSSGNEEWVVEKRSK